MEGKKMVESVTDEGQPGEIGRHARDYSRFTKLLKWSAIVCAIIALLVLLIIS